MKNPKFWIGVAISTALIIWAFSRVDMSGLGRALLETDYLYLSACLPIVWLTYALRAWRWEFLLKPVKDLSFKPLMSSVIIGFTGNLILPARLGEVIRAVDLGRREGVPLPAGLMSIVMERILDGLAIIGFLIGSSMILGVFDKQTPLAQNALRAVQVFSAVYVALLVAVVAVAVKPQASMRMFGIVLSPLPQKLGGRLLGICQSLVDGMLFIKKPRLLLISLMYTVILWAVNPLPLWLLARGVDHPASYVATLFVQGIICLAVAVPSAPGFVGVIHFAIQVSFGDLLGMPAEKALALAIIYHGSSFIFTIVYALIILARDRMSIFDLGKLAEKKDPLA